MCVRGEELSVGTKLGFTKWGATKVKFLPFNPCQGYLSMGFDKPNLVIDSLLNNIFS